MDAGNFTEPLLLVFSTLLLMCILSGHWWIFAYAMLGVVIYLLVLAYSIYLENTAQTEVERRHRARTMRPKPRRETFRTASSSDAGRSSSGYS